MTYARLGDLLLSVGLITQEQLGRALCEQKKTEHRLGRELIGKRVITERRPIEALRVQFGVEFVDLSSAPAQPQLAELLPKEIAQKCSVIPVRLKRDILSITMNNPVNFVAIEEVKISTRKRIILMIATTKAIDHAISKLYGSEGATRAIADMKREMEEGASVCFTDNFTASVPDEEEDTASVPTIRLVSSTIERAVLDAASDTHVEPHERELLTCMWVDDVMRSVMSIPKDLQGLVVSCLKIMDGMDVTERRILQGDRAAVRVQRHDIDMRLSTLLTIYGEKVVVRLLNKDSQLLSEDKIGLNQDEINQYMNLISRPSGTVLIVGPTESGKSSTMYTMVHELNIDQVNLAALEDPAEYNTKETNQVQINEETGLTFADNLRSILRRDPDIATVDEIRDGETAQIAVCAAITGYLALSTVRMNDVLATINRLVDTDVEPYITSSALNGIVSQRLVRRICPNCRQEYTPQSDDLLSIDLDPYGGHKLYRGVGCPSCFSIDYRGHTAAFEILVVSHALRMATNRDARREKLGTIVGTEQNFIPLTEGVRRLVLQGVTTIEEA